MLTPLARVRRNRRHDPDDWQRTDGGVYVPRVPMRGGMVRRGMGFGFEPAGCCCEVDDRCVVCNESHVTLEFDVTLSGFGGFFTPDCRYFNDTFRVTYNENPPTGYPFNSYSGAWWYAFIDEENVIYGKYPEIWMSIQCQPPSFTYPTISITPCLRGEDLEPQVHFWETITSTGEVPINCSVLDETILLTDFYPSGDCATYGALARIQGVA